jgi:hypothetical protein
MLTPKKTEISWNKKDPTHPKTQYPPINPSIQHLLPKYISQPKIRMTSKTHKVLFFKINFKYFGNVKNYAIFVIKKEL